MTVARREIVKLEITRYYHLISQCAREEPLMEIIEGCTDRKSWLEDRMQFLAQHYAIEVGGFSIRDDYLHVIVRVAPDMAKAWSAEEVVRRWSALCPPIEIDLNDSQALNAWITEKAQDAKFVKSRRERLMSISWFMKQLKEPLARLANREDEVRGPFWQPRFRSIAILDMEALLATSIYVDLNVFAAGLAPTLEESPHTSIHQRVERAKQEAEDELPTAAQEEGNAKNNTGSEASSEAAGKLGGDLWMIPIEDRRSDTGAPPSLEREGMLGSFSLESYLDLLDFMACCLGSGKANLDAEVEKIFGRLNASLNTIFDAVKSMLGAKRLRGYFFALNPEKARQYAEEVGNHRVNLSPQMFPS